MRETQDTVNRTASGTTTTMAAWTWLKLNGIDPKLSPTADQDGIINQFTARYPHHVITTSIGREAVNRLLRVTLRDRPFSCGRDAEGDLACSDEHPRCCVLAYIRHRMAEVQGLLGLFVDVFPRGSNRPEGLTGHGDELMRAWGELHGFLESLNRSAFELDEGLSGFECDHVVEPDEA